MAGRSANQFHHLSHSFGNGYYTSPKFHYGINPTVPRFYHGNQITSYILFLGKYNGFRPRNPVLEPNPNRVLLEREGRSWESPTKLKPLPNPSVTTVIQHNDGGGKHRLARRNLIYMRENAPAPEDIRRLQAMEAVEMRIRRRSQRELEKAQERRRSSAMAPPPAKPPANPGKVNTGGSGSARVRFQLPRPCPAA